MERIKPIGNSEIELKIGWQRAIAGARNIGNELRWPIMIGLVSLRPSQLEKLGITRTEDENQEIVFFNLKGLSIEIQKLSETPSQNIFIESTEEDNEGTIKIENETIFLSTILEDGQEVTVEVSSRKNNFCCSLVKKGQELDRYFPKAPNNEEEAKMVIGLINSVAQRARGISQSIAMGLTEVK